MELNSCLYETQIMHHRLHPQKHRFAYGFFSFYLDLDEIDGLVQRTRFLGRNRFNVYSFFDQDHVQKDSLSIRASILEYLKQRGIELDGGRIMLLTYVRTFGYVFNPVSFYYCFDRENRPVCVIPEIGNTFGELKLYLLSGEDIKDDVFKGSKDKSYYISPFTKLDDQLDFRLGVPGQRLNIGIDTSRNGGKVIVTTMTGHRKELNDANLLWLSLKFPLVTLKVIGLIHWHAFMLWIKKLPYEEKNSNLHLQKEVYRAWNKGYSASTTSAKHPEIKYSSKDH